MGQHVCLSSLLFLLSLYLYCCVVLICACCVTDVNVLLVKALALLIPPSDCENRPSVNFVLFLHIYIFAIHPMQFTIFVLSIPLVVVLLLYVGVVASSTYP